MALVAHGPGTEVRAERPGPPRAPPRGRPPRAGGSLSHLDSSHARCRQRSTQAEVEAFRGLWTLDPEVHFLNHGSFGACPAEVLDEQRAWRDRMEREPVAFLARELQPHLDTARERLAEFVGCDAGGLVLVPNATTGVNAVLRSLELGRDDEVLITTLGYNACNNAARFVCERSGARLVEVAIPFPCSGPTRWSSGSSRWR